MLSSFHNFAIIKGNAFSVEMSSGVLGFVLGRHCIRKKNAFTYHIVGENYIGAPKMLNPIRAGVFFLPSF